MSLVTERPGEVRILAPAKLNLGLAVLGRRPDGFHELLTVFQAVSLSDRLRVRRRRRGVRVRCAELPGLGADNLAHRAAELFLERSGAAAGLEIDLEKRIPAGGGLGGGSSDAAAVLLAAARLHRLRPPREQLNEWAASLGADVPFFLEGGAGLGTGRGELVSPLEPWPGEANVLLHVPERGLATAEVYRRLDAGALTGRRAAFNILLARRERGELGPFGAAMFNDLEAAAFEMMPELAAAKAALLGAGAAGALLAGSGSCVFGLFAGREAAEGARRRLRNRLPGRMLRLRFLRPRRRWGVVKR